MQSYNSFQQNLSTEYILSISA